MYKAVTEETFKLRDESKFYFNSWLAAIVIDILFRLMERFEREAHGNEVMLEQEVEMTTSISIYRQYPNPIHVNYS